MTLRTVPTVVAAVFWLVLLAAVLDRTVGDNPSAATGIFGAGVGALLWTLIALDQWRNRD